MNAHNAMWNPYCHHNVNVGPLKELIESYELIVKNNTNFSTRPSSPGISIFDLAVTSLDLGPLRIWKIPEEYLSLSDHELILIEWENMDIQSCRNTQAVMNG